jgi:hypothetical protein
LVVTGRPLVASFQLGVGPFIKSTAFIPYLIASMASTERIGILSKVAVHGHASTGTVALAHFKVGDPYLQE